MTVTRNNQQGYAGTAQSRTYDLQRVDTTATTDIIPLESRLGSYTARGEPNVSMILAAPVTALTRTSRSDPLGHLVLIDFQIPIPGVNSDTYSATLDDVATML